MSVRYYKCIIHTSNYISSCSNRHVGIKFIETGEVELIIGSKAKVNEDGNIIADPDNKEGLKFEMLITNKQCLVLRSCWGFMGLSTNGKLTCNNTDYTQFQLEASTNPKELGDYYIKGM